jgi:hypothetical protein
VFGRDDKRPAEEPETRLESADEIRRAIKARRAPAPKGAAEAADATAFRPTRRPPLTLLCILDDASEDGEWVRLRRERVVLGRVEGDIVIPHDTMMSSRHAELVRRQDQGRTRWLLTDLQSTNGTFVRVGNALLKPGQELLIGSHCYRFDAATSAAITDPKNVRPVEGTVGGWMGVTPADLVPSLVELTPKGEGQKFFLNRPENWLGADPQACSVVIANDPYVSPQHARIFRDTKGAWHAANNKSLNGIWLRVERAPLEGTCQFQLGEQRFLLRVL